MGAVHDQPLLPGWTVEGVYWAQAIGVLVTGAAFAALAWRGPLEWVTHAANQVGSYRPALVRQPSRFR
jgi:hypothetical protein